MSLSDDEIRHPPLTLRHGRYYEAAELQRHLQHIADETRAERDQAAARQAQYQELLQANQRQTATIALFRDKIAQQQLLLEEQVRQISALGEQLNRYRTENVAQSERMAQQNVQISRLQAHIEHLGEQITLLEGQNTDELTRQAAHKADQLVQQAIADSDRILLQAAEQRGRLIAACRAAYYSALQFKQDLAEQFRNMERELDASIDVLQLLDNTRLNLNHTAVPTEPAPGDGRVLP